MRIGVYQFHGSSNIDENRKKILCAIDKAAAQKIRLLVFQECAICGYPPIETPKMLSIDYDKAENAIEDIKSACIKNKIYAAVGTIRRSSENYYNSICVISPEGHVLGYYDKSALWGWDTENFSPGDGPGIFQIDEIRVAFRICFEIRFPECFRECFIENVQLCFVSFCDVQEHDSIERYNIIKGHLITRAVENIMTVVSVNSISNYQSAPTAVFDQNGVTLIEAVRNKECLLSYDFNTPEISFGMQGRIENSKKFLNRAL